MQADKHASSKSRQARRQASKQASKQASRRKEGTKAGRREGRGLVAYGLSIVLRCSAICYMMTIVMLSD
jgi:hypothetical protein